MRPSSSPELLDRRCIGCNSPLPNIGFRGKSLFRNGVAQRLSWFGSVAYVRPVLLAHDKLAVSRVANKLDGAKSLFFQATPS